MQVISKNSSHIGKMGQGMVEFHWKLLWPKMSPCFQKTFQKRGNWVVTCKTGDKKILVY